MTTRTLPLDQSALCLSGLCLLHCLALPFASSVLPLFGTLAEAEWVHRVFVFLAIPVAVGAIVGNDGRSRGFQTAFATAVLTGLALLILGAFVERLHDWEVALTTAGALMLASAHLWRWRTRRPI